MGSTARLCIAAAALFGSAACTPPVYVCTAHEQCDAPGRCEASGWCSRPDDGCPSGRRFVDGAAPDVARRCVPSQDEDAGTSSSSPELSDASSSGASTGDLATCGGWRDDFDDGAFGRDWTQFGLGWPGHQMVERDGVLRWTFAVDGIHRLGLQRSLEGWTQLRFEIGDFPPQGAELVAELSRTNGPPYELSWSDGALEVRTGLHTELVMSGGATLELRRAPDGAIALWTAVEGGDLEKRGVLPRLDTEHMALRVYGHTPVPVAEASSGSIDSIELCE